MTRKVVIDIFVEDRSHEAFLKPLIERIAQEEKIVVLTRVRSARGGHGKAMEEYSLYQDYLLKGFLIDAYPDLIVVAIDGNCLSFSKMRGEIQNKTKPDLKHLIVGACPDPHVERWSSAQGRQKEMQTRLLQEYPYRYYSRCRTPYHPRRHGVCSGSGDCNGSLSSWKERPFIGCFR
jgi:hypothetical protein